MIEANFRTFSLLFSTIHLQSANSYMTAKTVHIKLHVPIIDAKTIFSFSILHKLHHKQLFHKWFTFSRPHSKISRLFQHLSPNSRLLMALKIKRWISGPVETLPTPLKNAEIWGHHLSKPNCWCFIPWQSLHLGCRCSHEKCNPMQSTASNGRHGWHCCQF